MAKKSHKRHGTVRTDLSKRKKPTVAKRVSQEFRSKRVRPTQKERIMAKAHKDYGSEEDTEPAATEEPAAQEVVPTIDDLVKAIELNYRHGAPVNSFIMETAKMLAGTPK